MNLKVTTQPASEPVTEAELEESLTLTSGWDNTSVSRKQIASRRQVELDTDRSLITQTLTMKLDNWPEKEDIVLFRGPVQSVTSVKYQNTSDVQTTLVEDTDYTVAINGDEARITPISSWPSLYATKKDVIEVIYVAGYGDNASDVPADLKEAIVSKFDQLYSKDMKFNGNYEALITPMKVYSDYTIND